MNKKITEINIRYTDGSTTIIGIYDLQKLEELGNIMSMIERAEMVYNNLKPIFGEKKK